MTELQPCKCGANDWRKHGTTKWFKKGQKVGKQGYICRQCGTTYTPPGEAKPITQ